MHLEFVEQFRLALRRDDATLRPHEREVVLTRNRGSEIRLLIMVLFPVLVALMWRDVVPDAQPWFLACVVGCFVMSGIGWTVPWRRLPRWVESLPAMCAVVFIWAMVAMTGGATTGYAALVVITVTWFACYGDPLDVVVSLALLATCISLPVDAWFEVLPDQGAAHLRTAFFLIVAFIIVGVRPTVAALREQVRGSRRATHSLRSSQAALAHDLRTPLTSMCALATLAEKRLESVESAAELDQDDVVAVLDYVHRIAQLGWQAEKIIGGVLDLSHAAELLPHIDTIDVADVIEDVARSVDGVTVTMGDVPAEILGHELSIRRLFANLFENAALHGVGPAPSDIARVEVEGSSQVGGWRFTVRDHGPGIAPDEAALVFQPWRRGASARDGGHGLGLAIAQAIVEQHGGTIQVIGAEPTGACFSFTLARAPLLASDHDEVVARSATGVPLA